MFEGFAQTLHWGRRFFLPAACCLALVYFAYHSVQGERGLLSWVERSAEVERAQARVAVLTAERDRLDRRVMLLREESLDLDMLDEQARRLLNLGLPDERILFTAGGSPPSEG